MSRANRAKIAALDSSTAMVSIEAGPSGAARYHFINA
jgi:hypothetical protein